MIFRVSMREREVQLEGLLLVEQFVFSFPKAAIILSAMKSGNMIPVRHAIRHLAAAFYHVQERKFLSTRINVASSLLRLFNRSQGFVGRRFGFALLRN